MPILSSGISSSRCWWPSHLGECACRTGIDVYEYCHEAFGVSAEEMSRFYRDSLNLSDPCGQWPQFVIAVPNHSIVISYFGEPRHEVSYGHSGDHQVAVWSKDCGNFMRPGFRWHEIERLSRLTAHPALALLLLLPSCDIPQPQVAHAAQHIGACFESLGYSGPLISRLSRDLADGCASERRWFYDRTYGWLTDDHHSWRCRDRPQRGLVVPDDESFLRLKQLTDMLDSLQT